MPLYTTIYTTYYILLSSDKFRKGQVRSMNSDKLVKRLLKSQTISNSGIRNLIPEPIT
jgi:hypothetical protein